MRAQTEPPLFWRGVRVPLPLLGIYVFLVQLHRCDSLSGASLCSTERMNHTSLNRLNAERRPREIEESETPSAF